MNTNRYRLLLVEDESSIRNFIRTVLETNDYQVLTTGTCQQALMMFSSRSVSVDLSATFSVVRDALCWTAAPP